eukprot:CAMPEP_0119396850 /NCGR_PEP_ID=MMETSP1334-20130426/138639_1 /TAXON_ID=127549 /ORGANISM="Calcidiscus leptoporus, Strain RCC1130" /LENGTH=33 /DNA_ID= /DNA_START= /DNA_END= /DNA_ORIENTATION=
MAVSSPLNVDPVEDFSTSTQSGANAAMPHSVHQ